MDIKQQQILNEIKFSVSMCVYKNDNPEHFHQAIESIINQTILPNEIVLVVDGPIPPSIDHIIKLYEKEDFFNVIRLPENVGHGNARRMGLENCTYEIVALMDADDISLPDRFEKQIRCFKEDNSLSIVGGNIEEFIETPNNIIGIRAVPEKDKEIKEYLKKRCPLNQVTVMFKASEVEAAGGYIDWFNEEDYYLWIRMFQNNAVFKNLNDTLVYVRVGNEMYSRRGGWKYFSSEAKLQKYMLNNKIINVIDFVINVSLRFVVQVLMPNKVRGLVFARFARTKTSH
jgi:glycosyltransferase involved in cell wall biosynthesis